MLTLIKTIAKVLSILNSEISHKQIATGFAYGALLGLLPVKGLLPYVLLFFGFIINVNLVIMFVAAAIFKLISFVVDPVANQLGYFLLVKSEGLKSLWTSLYNMPLVPFTRFNNTLVMGSLVVGVLLFLPLIFFMIKFVKVYRTRFRDQVQKFKLVQIFKTSALYRFYESYKNIRGNF